MFIYIALRIYARKFYVKKSAVKALFLPTSKLFIGLFDFRFLYFFFRIFKFF